MTRRSFGLVWVVACAACVLGAAWPALAQGDDEIRVRARVSAGTVYVGDRATLEIIIDGAELGMLLDELTLDDAEIVFDGGRPSRRTEITIINGRRSENVWRSYSLRYLVTPTREGVYTTPELRVLVNGAEYLTPPIEFRAVRPEESEDVRLILSVSDASPYVGESIEVTLEWYLATSVSTFRFSGPTPEGMAVRATGEAAPPRAFQTRMLGAPTWALEERGELEGRRWTVLRFRVRATPDYAGRMVIGPVRSIMKTSSFARRGMTFAAESNAVEVDVRPLPEEGRPADFSGLVGSYGLISAAQPTRVSVGEPIRFMVGLDGTNEPSAAPVIDLSAVDGFAEAFRVPDEPLLPYGLRRQGVGYEAEIRALSAEVDRIPAVELSVFDPEAGAYTTIRAPEIALEVEARAVVALDGEIGQSGTADDEAVDDGPALERDPDALTGRAPAWSALSDRGMLVALAVGPVGAGAYLAIAPAVAGARRRHASAGARARRARRRLRRACGAGDVAAIDRALDRYCAALGLGAASEAIDALHEVDDERGAAMRGALDRLHRSRFSPDGERGVDDAARVIDGSIDALERVAGARA